VDKQKRWKLEKSEFVDLNVVEGSVSEADIRTGLKKAIDFIKEYNVPGQHIHFVVSSGAKDEKVVVNSIAELKKLRYVVNVVSPEAEGKYAFATTMPKEFVDKGFVVDIGSGNTKLSFMQNGSLVGLETVGAKYYVKQETKEVAYARVKTEIEKVPVKLRKVCFIIGGVPYNLAKAAGHQKGKLYTRLKQPNEYQVGDADKKDSAKAECGMNIYSAIVDESGCKEFIFVDGTFFSIGFLIDLPY
jgi:hypothetical protein